VNARFVGDQTPLHVVAQLEQVGVMRSLLKKRRAKLEAENENKETPLFLVARNGNVDAVKLLLKRKAKVNRQDRDGRTPLMWHRKMDMIQLRSG
jgi:ankyrin repeat protein